MNGHLRLTIKWENICVSGQRPPERTSFHSNLLLTRSFVWHFQSAPVSSHPVLVQRSGAETGPVHNDAGSFSPRVHCLCSLQTLHLSLAQIVLVVVLYLSWVVRIVPTYCGKESETWWSTGHLLVFPCLLTQVNGRSEHSGLDRRSSAPEVKFCSSATISKLTCWSRVRDNSW